MANGEVRQRVASNLRLIASVTGVKQVSIATACGVTKGAVSNWMKGTNSIDIELIPTIADVLGVPVDLLLGKEVDAKVVLLIKVFRSLAPDAQDRVLAFADFELKSGGSDQAAGGA
jgi:transcriptional regulator with XRE-family HTH domain